jgi:hypothetical protein
VDSVVADRRLQEIVASVRETSKNAASPTDR